MQQKVIQLDMEQLKALFQRFENRDNIYRLLSMHDSMAYSLDKQEFFTLSGKILEAKKLTDNVNKTLLEIKKMLISSGCLLD